MVSIHIFILILFIVAIIIFFLDVYTLSHFLIDQQDASKELRLGISATLSIAMSILFVSGAGDVFYSKNLLVAFTIISGILFGVFLEIRNFKRKETYCIGRFLKWIKPVAFFRVTIVAVLFNAVIFGLLWYADQVIADALSQF